LAAVPIRHAGVGVGCGAAALPTVLARPEPGCGSDELPLPPPPPQATASVRRPTTTPSLSMRQPQLRREMVSADAAARYGIVRSHACVVRRRGGSSVNRAIPLNY